MLTIAPPLSRIARPHAWAMKYEPFRLMSMTRRNSSGVSRVAGTAVPTPALLMRTSTPPSCSTVSATTRSQSSGLATSAAIARQRRPVASTSSRVCWSFSTRRAQIATSAPAPARPVANATPSPDEAPVTIATFPSSLNASRTPGMGADCNVAGVITPEQAVDAINDRFGHHPGCRALHAKGTLVAGTFTATPEGARLTRAGHMQGEPVRATVRFSNGAGDPDEPDYGSDVRGMATKLYLADDTRTDIVAQTSPRFVTRTPDGFIEFIKASEPGVQAAWRLPWFLARHREALAALRSA